MHPVIYDEIFNIEHKVSEVALDFIRDELDKYQIDIAHIIDYDHTIVIKFSKNLDGLPIVYGEIRIDRIYKCFTITGYCQGFLLPAIGDWNDIEQYLYHLVNPQ